MQNNISCQVFTVPKLKSYQDIECFGSTCDFVVQQTICIYKVIIFRNSNIFESKFCPYLISLLDEVLKITIKRANYFKRKISKCSEKSCKKFIEIQCLLKTRVTGDASTLNQGLCYCSFLIRR